MRKTAGKGKSRLVCGECRHVAPIFRPSTQKREVGHVKHMYCPTCWAEKPFIEHTVSDKVEMLWALDAINTNSELGKMSRIYNRETEEFLAQEEQVALLTGVCEELEMTEHNLNAELAMSTLKEKGYNIHILKDYR